MTYKNTTKPLKYNKKKQNIINQVRVERNKIGIDFCKNICFFLFDFIHPNHAVIRFIYQFTFMFYDRRNWVLKNKLEEKIHNFIHFERDLVRGTTRTHNAYENITLKKIEND